MGLVVANNVGLSGLVAPKPDVQIFTSSGTWTKPAGCTRVYMEVIGGGGSGGGGGSRGNRAGGTGTQGDSNSMPGFGEDGGDSVDYPTPGFSGGGGGAGQAGIESSSGFASGKSYSQNTASPVEYGQGGDGARYQDSTGGGYGSADDGRGGGGGGGNSNGGAGSPGIVIFRYAV